MNADQVAGQPTVKPEWSSDAERAWAATQAAAARDDGGGPSPASHLPAGVVRLGGARLQAASSGGDCSTSCSARG